MRIHHLLALCIIVSSVAPAALAGEYSVTPLEHAKDRIRVAAVQMNVSGGPEEVLAACAPYIQRAGQGQVDLLVFPEYVLGNFKVPDMLTDGLCALAREHNLNLIAGGWQFLGEHPITWPPEPGTYANCALIIDRRGEIVGLHHKMHAAIGAPPYFWPETPGERGEHTMVPGNGSAVIALDFGRIAVLTCYDGYFFHSFEVPALQGAEVLVWINGRGGAVEEHFLRTASFMNCVHLVATNQSIGAGTGVCAYPGEMLARADEPGDAYVTAELDLVALRVQRRNHRMFHQRRPELCAPLAQDWRPYDAYPDIPLHAYPEEE